MIVGFGLISAFEFNITNRNYDKKDCDDGELINVLSCSVTISGSSWCGDMQLRPKYQSKTPKRPGAEAGA
jgi:hypothetical protein